MSYTESLIHGMEMVSLADEEEAGFEIVAEENESNQIIEGFDPKLCIVGRFITEDKVDFLAMQHTLAALWKPGKGVYMKELDNNLYLFQFYHELDVKRVMEGCPCSFNKRALVMARLKEGENPRLVDLSTMELWVQIHDLKIGFMSEKVLKGIGSFIGQFISSCPNNFTGVWREYMRVRVSINLNSPLKRRMKIKMAGEEWFWVNFKYENIPTFCFICGVVGHSEKFCSKLFELNDEEVVKPYGAFMRAPFRGHVKPIGAKWLKTEMAGSSSTSETVNQGGYRREVTRVNVPQSEPNNPESSLGRENQGKFKLQAEKSGAGKESVTEKNLSATITENEVIRKDFAVIETKKRRTGDGLDSYNDMGLNKDVIMEVQDELGNEKQDNIVSNELSKNGLKAGIQRDARLSS